MSGEGGNQQGSKRKRSYYSDYHKKNRGPQHLLIPGLTGFLVTCNNREKDTVRESYNLLNEYIELIYPKSGVKTEDDSAGDEGGDLEAEIAKEVSALKTTERLQQCDSKCKNIVFIKAPGHVDPIKVVQKVLEDIEAKKEQKTRFALRLIPVTLTFKAAIDAIEKGLGDMIDKVKAEMPEEATYMVQSKVRNNNSVTRTAIIEATAKIVREKLPEWKVNFDTPKMTLNLDVLGKVCCAAFLSDFDRFKKYNVVELAGGSKDKETKGSAADNGSSDNKDKDVKKENEEEGTD